MQVEPAATSGYHASSADVGQTKYQMMEATIGALTNLATATAANRGVVATFTEANARLARQLEYLSKEVKEVKSMLKKERADCNFPKYGHKHEATKANNIGGCQAHKV
jgi:hypothetical protein